MCEQSLRLQAVQAIWLSSSLASDTADGIRPLRAASKLHCMSAVLPTRTVHFSTQVRVTAAVQAYLWLHPDGRFRIRNVGHRHVTVNARQVRDLLL